MTMISVSGDRLAVREIVSRRRKIADTLAASIRPDGSFDDHCGSRILESALLAGLLRRTGQRPEVQVRLRGYLTAADPAHRLDRIIQQAICGVSGLRPEAEAFLSTFEHATGARKQALLARCWPLCSHW